MTYSGTGMRPWTSEASIDGKELKIACATRVKAAAGHDLALIWKRLHGKGGPADSDHAKQGRSCMAIPPSDLFVIGHMLMQNLRRRSITFRSCSATSSLRPACRVRQTLARCRWRCRTSSSANGRSRRLQCWLGGQQRFQGDR